MLWFLVFFYVTPIPFIKIWSIISLGVYVHQYPLITVSYIINLSFISYCYKNDYKFTAIMGLENEDLKDLVETLKAVGKFFGLY